MSWPAEIPGVVIAGTYRLVRPIGGERGRVYEARHDRLPGRFAVKLFDNVDAEAFQRSAQFALALRNPGIAQVIDYGADPAHGKAAVVMEFLGGRPLSALVSESGLVPVERVVRIVGSIAGALVAAHRQGVTHGHLSPDCVFVVAEQLGSEQTKVVGFGLGAEVSATLELTELTPYTAPEQAEGAMDPHCDQFALAAIAYEMLTGVPPFDDSTERQPPPTIRDYIPDVSLVIDDIIQRALAPEPQDRWLDISTFAERLREAGGGMLEEKTRITPLSELPWETSAGSADGGGAALPTQASSDDDSIEIDVMPPQEALPRGGVVYPQSRQPQPRTLSGTVLGVPVSELLKEEGLALPPLARRGGAPTPASTAPAYALPDAADSAVVARPRPPASQVGRLLGRAVAFLATAGLVAFTMVKLDLWGYLQRRFGPADSTTPVLAVPASAPAPAAATAGAPADEAAPQVVHQPEVVPLPAAPQAVPEEAPPAPEPAVIKRHRSRRHRGSASSRLPPELAAKEALLVGGDTRPATKSARRPAVVDPDD